MINGVLGVDIGGVIIAGTSEHRDTFFNRNYLETPAVEGAYEGLQKLVNEHFSERVYLISKGGRHTAVKTRAWFYHHDFHQKTGVKEDHVYFCKERKDKVAICQRLGVTHFIDDLLEVLGYLYNAGIKNLYLFNPNINKIAGHEQYMPRVQPLVTWEDAVGTILRSVE